MSKLLRLRPGRPDGRRLGWRALAVLAYAAELWLFTSGRGCLGYYASPLLFYGAAVLLAGATLALLRNQPFTEDLAPRVVRRLGWGGLAWLLGGLLVLRKQVPIVLSQPVDIHSSDIIPAVQVYIERIRSGEVVYRYITSLPYPLFPVYLPLQWLPYTLAAQLGIDYRWLSLGLLLLVGFGAYQLVLVRRPLGSWRYLLLALLPGAVVWWMLRQDSFLYAQVLEPTIICYYFLLAASVMSRSAVLRAGAIVLCLLSRFSVIFWVPLFLWVLWRAAGRRHALLVGGLVALGILGIYVVPFLSKDWTIFTHALAEYRISSLGEWSRVNPATGLPLHLTNGLGGAPWVHRLLATQPVEVQLAWMQRLHLAASVGIVGLLAAFYWRYGHHYDYRYFALVALKLYLATFFFFLQVPYAYITSLSVLLSVFVLMLALGRGSTASRPAITPVSTRPGAGVPPTTT